MGLTKRMMVNVAAVIPHDVAISERARSGRVEQIIEGLKRIEEMLSAKGAVPREYLNIEEAADFIGVSRQTLDRWRMEATGPAVHRVGRRVLYSLADLRAFMETHRQEPLQ
ncbi:hypothetical protein NAP1_13623 [Erythrobacter sp. NAP1]|nr:hypothetical protein NAP1_13623 [Erythrobacter sp. NAP1]